jgi:hypothetical protein
MGYYLYYYSVGRHWVENTFKHVDRIQAQTIGNALFDTTKKYPINKVLTDGMDNRNLFGSKSYFESIFNPKFSAGKPTDVEISNRFRQQLDDIVRALKYNLDSVGSGKNTHVIERSLKIGNIEIDLNAFTKARGSKSTTPDHMSNDFLFLHRLLLQLDNGEIKPAGTHMPNSVSFYVSELLREYLGDDYSFVFMQLL